MALVKAKHLALYKRYTEQLIADLSESGDVVLHNKSSQVQCTNCVYDIVHKCSSGKYNDTGPTPFTGGICPVCNGDGELSTSSTKAIDCTVNWGSMNENDTFVSSPGGSVEGGFFKMKTYIRYYDDLKNAEWIEIQGVRTMLVNVIKRGLKDNVVCVAICKRDD